MRIDGSRYRATAALPSKKCRIVCHPGAKLASSRTPIRTTTTIWTCTNDCLMTAGPFRPTPPMMPYDMRSLASAGPSGPARRPCCTRCAYSTTVLIATRAYAMRIAILVSEVSCSELTTGRDQLRGSASARRAQRKLGARAPTATQRAARRWRHIARSHRWGGSLAWCMMVRGSVARMDAPYTVLLMWRARAHNNQSL